MAVIKMTILLALSTFCLLGGCGVDRAVPEQAFCVEEAELPDVMAAAESVLTDMNFQIDKYSQQAGYVRTAPLPAGQLVEFWRKDNVGSKAVLEANLHSIRRTAEVFATEEDGQRCVDCRVYVERLSISGYEDSSGAEKFDKYSGTRMRGGRRKLELEGAQQRWIELSEDEKLAVVIRDEIRQRVGNNK